MYFAAEPGIRFRRVSTSAKKIAWVLSCDGRAPIQDCMTAMMSSGSLMSSEMASVVICVPDMTSSEAVRMEPSCVTRLRILLQAGPNAATRLPSYRNCLLQLRHRHFLLELPNNKNISRSSFNRTNEKQETA